MTTKKDKNDMSQFELGGFFARIETAIDSMSTQLAQVIRDHSAIHKDHEERIRAIETEGAKKNDVDELRKTIWKIIVWIAASGTGGVAILKLMGGI